MSNTPKSLKTLAEVVGGSRRKWRKSYTQVIEIIGGGWRKLVAEVTSPKGDKFRPLGAGNLPRPGLGGLMTCQVVLP
jgi:hypothetical protein